jgi:hypothetical protein
MEVRRWRRGIDASVHCGRGSAGLDRGKLLVHDICEKTIYCTSPVVTTYEMSSAAGGAMSFMRRTDSVKMRFERPPLGTRVARELRKGCEM